LGLGATALGLLSGCARKSGAEGVPSQSPPKASAPVASTATNAGTAHATSPEMGKALYDKYCKLCHGADATGYAADNAPSLVSPNFLASASDAFIAQGIRVGRSNTAMAAYSRDRGGPLDESQISAIVRWLRTKGPVPVLLPEATGGRPERGAPLFAQHCQTCHGSPGVRGTAPQLHNPEFLSSATPAFLRYAIASGRPPTTMLAFEGVLSPSEIDDLVAYIRSLAAPSAVAPVPSAGVPDNLPLVINPGGRHAAFKLRDDRFVSSADVARALKEKRRLVVVDARSPADWIQFHIPGSVPIPYYDVEKLKRIPNDGTWVVAYCACPHHASGEVVDALRRQNYKNTAILDEGILFWRDKGYPLAGEAPTKPTPSGSAPSPAHHHHPAHSHDGHSHP
jgi:mono/diheme cytochrome c family protein/rhodanese-related sulfurtransferase